jgi:hyperosmotically inducible periplasmic protein
MTTRTRTFRFIAVAAIAMLSVAACTSTRTQKSAGEQIDDTVITGKIKAELIGDPATKAHEIDVEVFKGRVQLNGFVRDNEMRQRAVAIAKQVSGVVAVDNNLKLKGGAAVTTGEKVDDGVLTARIKAALAEDERTKAAQINVETRDSVVLLAGFVNNAAARSAAAELARGVAGVTRVDNQISVK